jgi:hypothetical protein
VDSFPHSTIHTGDNSAGEGGDGHFSGALVSAPFAIYKPVDIALAGPHGTAHAHQSNTVQLDQDSIQIAGLGGNGGNGNAAIGGIVATSGLGHEPDHGLFDSFGLTSGANHAGNGGDGYFYGTLVHASFALYEPINIAVAGQNSTAQANQTNNVDINQSAVQMAGIGGNGGSGNTASGGTVGVFSSGFGFGSDAVATGDNSGGNGGKGDFFGKLIDASIAIYAPINIAISGFDSTTEAYQTNNASLDQSASQIAGIGGDGGNGDLALGGDFATHLLSDLHLLG